ncbi:hypothetical protein [Isoptericola sp. AK164]|uniref:hypothetical protein n=1 Tax=Isoptericola sp. AK164 TaxID=3024246 RepID=UPI0024182336|nr:hypothetical protein [Isoptericola sp. AK164]
MKKIAVGAATLALLAAPLAAAPAAAAGHGPHPSCWGQASAVFAQMQMMGEHSSSFPTPRVGLRNLARDLAEVGAIEDDGMADLGVFVATELGLEIDACL